MRQEVGLEFRFFCHHVPHSLNYSTAAHTVVEPYFILPVSRNQQGAVKDAGMERREVGCGSGDAPQVRAVR